MTVTRPELANRSFWYWLWGGSRSAATVRIVGSLLLFTVAWHFLSEYVIRNRLLVVSPLEVWRSLLAEIDNGNMAKHLSTTAIELAVAFPIAVLGGLIIGTILAASKPIRQTFDPILTAMYSLPVVALAPLFTSGLGFGIWSKVAIVILMAIFPVITSTDAALRSADSDLIEAAKSFRATRWQVLRTVTLPHSVPFIIAGIRVAFARALVGVIVAEYFGSIAGFGFAIAGAAQNYQTGRLLSYVVILGLIGLFGSLGLTALEKRLAPWKEN